METRTKKATLAAIATAATLAFAPLAAHAGSYSATLTTSCYNGLSTVGIELERVELALQTAIFVNQRDRMNLLSKLSSAASKAGVRKWADAIGKLGDISDTATALANAAKPKLTSGVDAIVNSA